MHCKKCNVYCTLYWLHTNGVTTHPAIFGVYVYFTLTNKIRVYCTPKLMV